MTDIRSFFTQKDKNGNSKPSVHKTSKSKISVEEKSNVKEKETKKGEVKRDKSSKNRLENGVEHKKKHKRIVIDSDSDEDPLPSKLRKEKKRKEEDDEDYKEVISPPKAKEKEKVKTSHSDNSSDKAAKPPPKKEVLKPVTAGDFFGGKSSVPTKRKKEKHTENDEPPSKKEKNTEKEEPSSKIKKNIENDDPSSKIKKNIEKDESSSKKEKNTEEGEPSSKIKKNIEKDVSSGKSPSSKKVEIIELSPSPKKSPSSKKTEIIETTPPSHKKKAKNTEEDEPPSKIKKNIEKDVSSSGKSPSSKKIEIIEPTSPSHKKSPSSKKTEIIETTPPSHKKSPSSKKTEIIQSTPPSHKKSSSSKDKEIIESTPPSHRKSPSSTKIDTNKSTPSSHKKSSSPKMVDIDVIEPTPPPQKKSEKKSSLAAKLSSKVKESESIMKVKTKSTEESVVKHVDKDSSGDKVNSTIPESKNKDALKDYISQAKEKYKTEKKEKTDSVKSSKEKIEKTPKSKPSPGKDKEPISEGGETPKGKKKPKDSSSDATETPKEKKNNSYWSFKAREGPTSLGSKELPVGSENCLTGLTFVITGVLECFEREQFVDCIQRYGGKVTSAVSGKTSFLITGREPGQSKITKAEKCGTRQIDEDGFIELVQTRSGGGTPGKSNTSASSDKTPSKGEHKKTDTDKKKKKSPDLSSKVDSKVGMDSPKSIVDATHSKHKMKDSPSSISSFGSGRNTPSSTPSSPSPNLSKVKGAESHALWVEKYKPKTMKQIVGQQGEKSNANKLKKWLLKWKENNTPGQKKNFMSGKEDGSIFKAALLSGPPGVGKTTTATLVCEETGFSFIEMNASDTRGKKALESEIKESLSNVTVNGMMKGSNNAGRNHVMIMDEVDGMAGNEDRGGMQELIQLIKKSQIPIICMCNDRNIPKMRSLANYCFDLRFYKPRVEQVKGFALSVAAKEGLKIPPQAMEQIVVGTNQDIRQVLHNMQMWTATDNSLNYDDAKANAKNASKNIKIGNFDIVKKLFSHSDSSKMTIDERMELFFMDYSFVPLFMQENYMYVNPAKGSGNIRTTLEVMSQAADAIADGNHVESLLRSKNAWSLLPLQGMFSTVIPSMVMSGYLGRMIEFPKWLGKNSSAGKHDRILQELKTHMAMSSDCIKTDINMEYMPLLKSRLTKPLIDTDLEPSVAAKEVISFMDDYNLTREDWDSITDIGKWGNEPDVTAKIPSKVKSAFTRLYNKDVHKTPYAVHQVAKKSKGQTSVADDVLVGEDAEDVTEEVENEDEEDISKDAMIKVKNEPKAGSSSKSKDSKTKTKTNKPKDKTTTTKKKK